MTSAETTSTEQRCPFSPTELRLYSEFDKYDFANDQEFQAGIEQLANTMQQDKTDATFQLRAKLFFFGR
jgi:hypothetical protein